MQHPEDDGHRHVRRVGVPQPVAETVEPAPVVERTDIVVHVEVGDVADLRNLQAPSSWASGSAADLQRAEAGREVAQLRVAEALVAEDHDGVAIYRGPHGIERGIADRLAEIDAHDLCGKRRRKWSRLDRHA